MNLPFLDRNLDCECGQLPQTVISGKVEGLASQASFGNKQVCINGEGAFYVYRLLPTTGAKMTERLETWLILEILTPVTQCLLYFCNCWPRGGKRKFSDHHTDVFNSSIVIHTLLLSLNFYSVLRRKNMHPFIPIIYFLFWNYTWKLFISKRIYLRFWQNKQTKRFWQNKPIRKQIFSPFVFCVTTRNR